MNSKIFFTDIVDTINFILKYTFFQFDGAIYQLIFGTPIGSPISPLFADIVMEVLETECLKILIEKHNRIPLFYYRYVDDIILCTKKEQQNTALEVFNSYIISHLKFTRETEMNNSIAFLDLSLSIDTNKIKTNWYQKPTLSGSVLNYHSNHIIQLKRNIV